MKRALIVGVMTIITSLATFFIVRMVGNEATALKSPASFTAKTTECRMSSVDGKVYYSETILNAVRQDGSRLWLVNRFSPRANRFFELKTIQNATQGMRYSIDPLTESITTTPISQKERKRLLATSAVCTNLTNPDTNSIMGFSVVRHTWEIPDKDRTLQIEQWRAPALDCFPLREETYEKSATSGSSKLIMTREVSEVSLGNPKDELFSIPQNYTERSPSQVIEELHSRFPKQTDRRIEDYKILSQADSRYVTARATMK